MGNTHSIFFELLERICEEFTVCHSSGALHLFKQKGWGLECYFDVAGVRGKIIGDATRADRKAVWVDASACWDKPSKCTIQLPLPENQAQMEYLIEKMLWLQTPEGLESAYTFNFIETYPEEETR